MLRHAAGVVPDSAAVGAALHASESVEQVAARWGCTPRSVRNVAARAGLALPQARRRAQRLSRLADRAWLRRALVGEGRSVSSVARELGLATAQVRAAANKDRIPVPTAPRVTYPRLGDRRWLAAQFAAGRTLKAIATALGCAPSSVRAAADRLGVRRGRRNPVQFAELHDPDWLRRRYVDDGRSGSEIAAELGCTPGPVFRAPHQAQLPVRPSVPTYPLLHDQVWLRRRYVDDQMSSSAIAAMVGCSGQTVISALQRAGIARRQQVRRQNPPAERLRADWRLFASVATVARLNDVSPDMAAVLLAEAGIFPGRPQVDRAELQAALDDGGSATAIGRRLGLRPAQARVELLRYGLTP